MASYLHDTLFTVLNLESCIAFCREVDIDGDGFISEEDLAAFVSRCGYFGGGVNRSNNELGSIYKSVIAGQNYENGDALS